MSAALQSDSKGFVQRFSTALKIQRWAAHGKPMSKNERGQLIGSLHILYDPEETAARDAIKSERKKLRDELKATMAASASNSSADADDGSVVIAFKSVTAATNATNAPAAAHAKEKSKAAAALTPAQLSTQCNVCYSDFNTLAPTSSEDPPLVLRVAMNLCGHNNICSDCFTAYLHNRIASDDIMPYIQCPEPNCKLTLSHSDLVAPAPTPQSVRIYENNFIKEQELIVARNKAAAANSDGTGEKGTKVKKTKAASTSSATKSGKRLAGNSSSSSSSSSDSDDAIIPSAPVVPIAPSTSSSSVDHPPLLSNAMLVQLVILHMSKVLARCKEWLPCGTFVKDADDASAAAEPKPAASAPSSSSSDDTKEDGSTVPAAAAAPSSSTPKCAFGFLLIPPLYNKYVSSSKPKLKKCDFCSCLQEVKPKDAEERRQARADDAYNELIENGTLRPCPICEALQMKDMGMCNILQCHGCQIWWNWSSRETGKNQAVLKDRARNAGTMWEPGELQYQLRLQRDDPVAFRDLLARNGIEYKENYVRGYSH